MSKALAFIVLGAGTAAIGTTGIYLMNRKKDISDLPFEDLSAFKNSKGGACSKSLVGDVDYTAEANGTDITINAAYFSGSDAPKSCLVVNWKRTDSSEPSNEKWKGYFRWLWTFVKGTKGFVMFVTTKPSSTANALDLDGGVYFVENKDNKWTVKKKKELTNSDSKTLSSTNIDGLPIPSDEIKKTLGNGLVEERKDKWGFIKDKDDFTKLCKDLETGGDCSTITKWKEPQEYKGSWIWSSDEKDHQKTIKDWSTNFPNWAKHLFGDADVSLKDVSWDTPKGGWKK